MKKITAAELPSILSLGSPLRNPDYFRRFCKPAVDYVRKQLGAEIPPKVLVISMDKSKKEGSFVEEKVEATKIGQAEFMLAATTGKIDLPRNYFNVVIVDNLMVYPDVVSRIVSDALAPGGIAVANFILADNNMNASFIAFLETIGAENYPAEIVQSNTRVQAVNFSMNTVNAWDPGPMTFFIKAEDVEAYLKIHNLWTAASSSYTFMDGTQTYSETIVTMQKQFPDRKVSALLPDYIRSHEPTAELPVILPGY